MTARDHPHTAPKATDLVRDPVCGMTVDPRVTEHRATREQRTYYFCSAQCHVRFDAHPDAFIDAAEAPTPVAVDGHADEYTCPMHPEIRQS